MRESERWRNGQCPKCGSKNTYESEDLDSTTDPNLYQFCGACGNNDMDEVEE